MYLFKTVKTCMWKPEMANAPTLETNERYVANSISRADIACFIHNDYVCMYKNATENKVVTHRLL